MPTPSPQCPLRRPSARHACGPVALPHCWVLHATVLCRMSSRCVHTARSRALPAHQRARRDAKLHTQPPVKTNKQRAESRWGQPEPRRIVKPRLLALPRVVARVLGLPVCGSPCRLRTTATRPRCARPPPDRSRGKPRGVAAAAWGGRSASRDEPVFPVAGRAAPLVRPRVHRSGRAARRRARRLPRRRERVLSPRPYPCALGTNVPSDGLEYCRQSG